MKRLFIIVMIAVISVVVFIVVGFPRFTKETYLDKKVLDTASPFNVNIDIEFLRKLNPAYEQQ
jgi:hypothetical protein